VVSANYDGVNKYTSAIYDEVFIGCNSVLVSPFLLKNNTYVACGSILKGMIEQNSVILNNSKTMKSLYDTKTLFERLRTKG
jgi:bifunctional UDP-N-acetylglucosamine pyrophosphorylase/glucosamine-1-phosphate N-acetyltransferase